MLLRLEQGRPFSSQKSVRKTDLESAGFVVCR